MQNLQAIRIHTHPAPIQVSYETIRETVPNLLFPESSTETSSGSRVFNEHSNLVRLSNSTTLKPKFDIVLHIGMAPGRKFFALETCAHQDGYDRQDVKGKTMKGDTLWSVKYRAPSTLCPNFDTEDVWRRWKSGLVVRRSCSLLSPMKLFSSHFLLVPTLRHCPIERPKKLIHAPFSFRALRFRRMKIFAPRMMLGAIYAISSTIPP